MSVFKHYLLVVAISLLPIIIIFTTADLPHTHDGMVHLPRMAAYYKALTGGQILPRWANDLNYGYGMPLFNFMYHTPYFLSSILIMAKFSLVLTFKLVIALSFLLSAITMFAFARELFADNRKAFVVTIFYQFAPFRLVEVLVRGSFGEMYTYAFLPLVLFGITKLSKKPTFPYLLLTAIATGFLIISHNSISLIFFGLISLFLLFFVKKKHLAYASIALILGLLLASFYWLPALLEHKYTLGDLYMKDIFRTHFPSLANFFIPNFLNTENFQTGGVSVQFGFFHVVALLAGIHVLLTKKVDSTVRKITIFSFVLIGVSLFFMQPVSIIFWEKISLLRQFQFPWRLLSVTSVATSLLAVNFFSYSLCKKKWIFMSVIILTIISTAYYWYPPLGFDKITNEREFWDYPLTTTYFGETDVIWSAGPAKNFATYQMEPTEGIVRVSNIIKHQTVHTAVADAKTDGRLVDNTQYFPGWRAYVNNVKVPIEFQDPNYRGLITFPVPKGTSQIRIAYERSGIEQISEQISSITVVFFVVISIISIRKKYL